MGTRPACRIPDGTRSFRHRDPVRPEQRTPGRALRCASRGAPRHIRDYRLARTRDWVKACASRRAHRRCRYAHVRRAHGRQAGTVAIHRRQRAQGCRRRRWWNDTGAAASGREFQSRTYHLKSRPLIIFPLLVGLATFCGPAFAHHGSASYKTDKLVALKQATVTKYLWVNPHAMLLFDVKDHDGNVWHWTGEADSPSAVRPLGWTRNSFQP